MQHVLGGVWTLTLAGHESLDQRTFTREKNKRTSLFLVGVCLPFIAKLNITQPKLHDLTNKPVHRKNPGIPVCDVLG